MQVILHTCERPLRSPSECLYSSSWYALNPGWTGPYFENDRFETFFNKLIVEMCMGMGFPMGPESHRNPMRMGIKHRIGNGNGREWGTTSVGMGITCTPMGIIPKGRKAANQSESRVDQRVVVSSQQHEVKLWHRLEWQYWQSLWCSFYLWMLCMVTVIALNVPSAWLWSLKLNQNANLFSIVIIND